MPETLSDTPSLRYAIHSALQALGPRDSARDALPLAQGATALLAALGYRSDKTADLGHTAETLLSSIEQFRPELGRLDRAKMQAHRWASCAFLFQLTDDEIPALALGQALLSTGGVVAPGQVESFVFLAIDLQGQDWPRGQLTMIVRELNKRFPMPAIVLFRHEELFSLAVIDRRQHRRDASRVPSSRMCAWHRHTARISTS